MGTEITITITITITSIDHLIISTDVVLLPISDMADDRLVLKGCVVDLQILIGDEVNRLVEIIVLVLIGVEALPFNKEGTALHLIGVEIRHQLTVDDLALKGLIIECEGQSI